MKYLARISVACLMALMLWLPAAQAERRVALVIGNSKYKAVSTLANRTSFVGFRVARDLP